MTNEEKMERLEQLGRKVFDLEQQTNKIIDEIDAEAKELGLHEYEDYHAPTFDADQFNDTLDAAMDDLA